MKPTILKYGLYGAVTICLLSLLAWFAGSDLDLGTQEILGYASMVAALSFVYFGIRHFRDRLNSGMLSLGTGIRIGLGISLITALAFGILDLIYILWINPDFLDSYYAQVVADLKDSLPEEELAERLKAMEAEKEFWSSPWLSFAVMFLTVFLIGVVISLISALVLQRKASQPI